MAQHISLVTEHRDLTNQHERLQEANAATDSSLGSTEERLAAATAAKVNASLPVLLLWVLQSTCVASGPW